MTDKTFLTDAQYVKSRGHCCPNCNGNNVSAREHDFNSGTATQDVVCDDCNAEWVDVYNLIGYCDLDLSKTAGFV